MVYPRLVKKPLPMSAACRSLPSLNASFFFSSRDNRRMTDAAHNQHSESHRPSDRDCIVTTGPSRFQPARSGLGVGEVLAAESGRLIIRAKKLI